MWLILIFDEVGHIRKLPIECVIQHDEFLVHVFSADFVWQNENKVLDYNANKFSKKYDVNDMIRRVCKLICMYSHFRSVANRKQHTENDIQINNPEVHYLSTCIYLMVVRCSLHYDQFAYFNIYSSFLYKHQIHSLLKPNVWDVFVIFVLVRILRSLIKPLFRILWIKVIIL